jgi:enoyl-CoA hydratase/carnithine racemase
LFDAHRGDQPANQGEAEMPEIVTERFENILRIQFNRPEKKNAMTLNMYSKATA